MIIRFRFSEMPKRQNHLKKLLQCIWCKDWFPNLSSKPWEPWYYGMSTPTVCPQAFKRWSKVPRSVGLDPIQWISLEGRGVWGWLDFFAFRNAWLFPLGFPINGFFVVYKGLAALVSCMIFLGWKIFLIEKNVKNQVILWEANFLFNLERTLSRERKFSWPPRNPWV